MLTMPHETTHAPGTYGPRPAPPQAPRARAATDLALQRSLGSDYLQRLAEDGDGEHDGPSGCGCSGGCSGCGPVQASALVGPAGDRYEQEAERVAERIVATPGPAPSGPAPAAPRLTIQRLPAGHGGTGGTPAASPPTSGGRPLTPASRAFMEPRFGQDFTHVQLHTDTASHQYAAGIRARAFTHGHHIHLARNESEHDHRLLAHELTHVVQQRGGAAPAAETVQRAISPGLEQIEDYLGYGLFDWAITDQDATRSLDLLKSLPRLQQAVFFNDATHARRLRENLPDGRLPEYDRLAADVAGLQPPANTLETIEDRLSYGLFDWAVTDQDAVVALDLLKQLSGNQLATAMAAIDYDRLLDNLPDARKPELTVLYDRALGTGGTRQTEEGSHPGTLLSSVTFRSDHGLMKNNEDDWESDGGVYGEPEWISDKGLAKSRPISQAMGTGVRADVNLNISPLNAPAAPVRLTGRSTEPALNFEFSGTLHGGTAQTVPLVGTTALPDTVTSLENRQIVWDLEWQQWKREIARTRHSVYVTAGPPRAPAEVTLRRMRTSTRIVGEAAREAGSLDPHALVTSVMKRWNSYNLFVRLDNAWKLADDLATGAQCIDIVRFVQGVLLQVGLAGSTAAVVVWAKPSSPDHAEETFGGGLSGTRHPDNPWYAALIDANGCGNNFEAALRFAHGGVTRYYPGGADPNQVYSTPTDVLHVFQCLAWVEPLGPRRMNVRQILTTYPHGHCTTGELTCEGGED
ncbi:DUF4157 domain-containing protein [Streptomyces sp. NPDC058284]|uniref:eCIS core domain-containing protein n=1 Tax=unclassified Streptomyces TaxID=2593676 RepID=UPI0036538322